MFDVNTIAYSELTTEFFEEEYNKYVARDMITHDVKGEVLINGYTFNASSDDIFMQYKLWLTRPERLLGKKIEFDGTFEELADIYEELLVGAALAINEKSESRLPFITFKSNMNRTLQWLRSTDFYHAPASTRYHDSFDGGLLLHSIQVYNNSIDLLKTDAFANVSLAEATISALVHDWCKIGFYEPYYRNVKDEKTGNWEKVIAYRRNPKGMTLGHGATSMYLASRCFSISPEMASAIRWHMGEYNVAPNEMDELHKANATYPLCYLLQFADRLSCVDWNGGPIK